MSNKVLFVSTQMEAGGVQIRSTSMQSALLGEGVPTDLVFLYRKRAVFPEGEHLTSLLNHPPAGALEYLGIFARLWALIRRKRPTAVVGFAHYSSPFACIFAALSGVKRRVATQTNPPNTMPRVARLLDLFCGVTGIYTHNIAASNSVLNAFADYPASYRKRLFVVYNGISSQTSPLTKQQSRELFGLPPDAPLIIACGRLSYQKNHSFLLDVLKNLPGPHLAILGDGELRGELEQKAAELGIKDRVTFLGEVEPARVRDFLRSGDLFAFPSHYEAFGLAVAEAMMSGLPVVSSNHSALQEVVAEAGVLLPIDNPAPWVDAIQAILSDDARQSEMSERSKAQASKFTFESMLGGFKNAVMQ